MPLVRLAKLEDYQSFEMLGCTKYRITWCDKLCPGNPADDPQSGLQEFNDWQCSIAAGHEQLSRNERLAVIVQWCLTAPGGMGVRLAQLIITTHKPPRPRIGMEFDATQYLEPELAFRYELAFLNDEIWKLPAQEVLELQNLIMGN
ncbi:hypothetical protein LZ023_40590 (plasmid) [Pseudomonas silvicola]|nr:hypothetical protein LZ023_40865 [Pseudomonas silvicola]WAH62233.1 hypothetical protein LZ023_40590 [Pseudomonas silvicola]